MWIDFGVESLITATCVGTLLISEKILNSLGYVERYFVFKKYIFDKYADGKWKQQRRECSVASSVVVYGVLLGVVCCNVFNAVSGYSTLNKLSAISNEGNLQIG